MRRGLVGCLVLLTLTGCIGSQATPSDDAGTGGKSVASNEVRRPLQIPTMGPGAACPRTAGGRPSPDVAIALGSGPAYPVLGFEDGHVPPSPKGVVPLYANERKGSAYWHKTLWAVDPRYDGPLLVRGRSMDSPQALRFAKPSAAPGGSEELVSELEFRAEETDSWRYGPSVTILPGPGCYAFQVDGSNFSKVIVFEAARAS
jgi:hypothetical protein